MPLPRGVKQIGLFTAIEPNLHIALGLPPFAFSRAVGAFLVVGDRAFCFDNRSAGWTSQQCCCGQREKYVAIHGSALMR